MKVQKTISLDPESARIAEELGNFSQFVRVALHAYAMGDSVQDEQRKKRLWKRVADQLREEIIRLRTVWARETVELATTMADELFNEATVKARQQSELDFE